MEKHFMCRVSHRHSHVQSVVGEVLGDLKCSHVSQSIDLVSRVVEVEVYRNQSILYCQEFNAFSAFEAPVSSERLAEIENM